MRESILIICLLCLLNCNNTDKLRSNSSKIDTLTFTSEGFNSRHLIKLTSDNIFIDEERWAGCLGGGGYQKMYGTYKSNNRKNTFKPEKVEQVEYFEFTENEGFSEKREFEYHKDSVIFEMPNQYYIVEWKQDKYLLSESNRYTGDKNENDFIQFAKYFNSESRGFKLDARFLINAKTVNDSVYSEFNYNQIPEKYRKYFLKEPLSATITDFKLSKNEKNDSDGNYWIVEINKGTDNNVFDGLYFSDKSSFIDITTDSILQNKSYGIVYLFNDEKTDNIIGMELKTKW